MTEKSEDQFQELLAHMSVIANKMLQQTNKMDAIGLLLYEDNTIKTSLSIIDDNVSSALTSLQEGLVQQVRETSPLASCMAYPNYQDGQVIALLENNEHYLLQVNIPVVTQPHLQLDLENCSTEDGAIYLFGE
ncbi:MAG: hypothetical protein ABJ275_03720 [Maricaulaceae bacterium]